MAGARAGTPGRGPGVGYPDGRRCRGHAGGLAARRHASGQVPVPRVRRALRAGQHRVPRARPAHRRVGMAGQRRRQPGGHGVRSRGRSRASGCPLIWDAVVVGAGPAGSTTALLLARAGASVLLLDRARFPRDKRCSEYLSPATTDVLERLGGGILAAVERTTHARLYGMKVVAPGGAAIVGRFRGASRPYSFAVPRTSFDAILVAAAARAGAEVREGITVEDLVSDGGIISGVVRQSRRDYRSEFMAELNRFPGLGGRFDGRRLVREVLTTGPFAQWARVAGLPGALLVGDAADFFDPFTGQGIHTALRGAELVAECLIPRFAPGVSRAYASARRREFAGKWLLERLIGLGVSSPALTDRVVGRLARRADLADLLVSATGNVLPARRVFTPSVLARLLW